MAVCHTSARVRCNITFSSVTLSESKRLLCNGDLSQMFHFLVKRSVSSLFTAPFFGSRADGELEFDKFSSLGQSVHHRLNRTHHLSATAHQKKVLR